MPFDPTNAALFEPYRIGIYLAAQPGVTESAGSLIMEEVDRFYLTVGTQTLKSAIQTLLAGIVKALVLFFPNQAEERALYKKYVPPAVELVREKLGILRKSAALQAELAEFDVIPQPLPLLQVLVEQKSTKKVFYVEFKNDLSEKTLDWKGALTDFVNSVVANTVADVPPSISVPLGLGAAISNNIHAKHRNPSLASTLDELGKIRDYADNRLSTIREETDIGVQSAMNNDLEMLKYHNAASYFDKLLDELEGLRDNILIKETNQIIGTKPPQNDVDFANEAQTRDGVFDPQLMYLTDEWTGESREIAEYISRMKPDDDIVRYVPALKIPFSYRGANNPNHILMDGPFFGHNRQILILEKPEQAPFDAKKRNKARSESKVITGGKVDISSSSEASSFPMAGRDLLSPEPGLSLRPSKNSGGNEAPPSNEREHEKIVQDIREDLAAFEQIPLITNTKVSPREEQLVGRVKRDFLDLQAADLRKMSNEQLAKLNDVVLDLMKKYAPNSKRVASYVKASTKFPSPPQKIEDSKRGENLSHLEGIAIDDLSKIKGEIEQNYQQGESFIRVPVIEEESELLDDENGVQPSATAANQDNMNKTEPNAQNDGRSKPNSFHEKLKTSDGKTGRALLRKAKFERKQRTNVEKTRRFNILKQKENNNVVKSRLGKKHMKASSIKELNRRRKQPIVDNESSTSQLVSKISKRRLR